MPGRPAGQVRHEHGDDDEDDEVDHDGPFPSIAVRMMVARPAAGMPLKFRTSGAIAAPAVLVYG